MISAVRRSGSNRQVWWPLGHPNRPSARRAWARIQEWPGRASCSSSAVVKAIGRDAFDLRNQRRELGLTRFGSDVEARARVLSESYAKLKFLDHGGPARHVLLRRARSTSWCTP